MKNKLINISALIYFAVWLLTGVIIAAIRNKPESVIAFVTSYNDPE
jgi:hypothetical protein